MAQQRLAPVSQSNYFFGGAIVSFATLATRNFTTVLALILIVSPVCGLRPSRALRSSLTSLPMPGMVNSPFFLVSLTAVSASSSRPAAACLLVISSFSAMWRTSAVFVIPFAMYCSFCFQKYIFLGPARLTCINFERKSLPVSDAKSSMFMRVRRTVPQFTFILSKRFVNHNSRVSTGFFRFFAVLFVFGHFLVKKTQQNRVFYFFNAFVSCPFCRSIIEATFP